MHEMSVCAALIDQVERIATQNNAIRVDKIVLTLGPLSGVECDLLQRAFPLAASGTIASEAEFEIEHSGVVVCCSVCGESSDVSPNRLLCANCGDFRTRVVSGDEMQLTRLELVKPTSSASRPKPGTHRGQIP